MGCGSSASQAINNRESIFKLEQILANNNEKQVNFANGRIYLFGQTRTQRKIIECETKLSSVKLISNKTRIPYPRIHQDPLELMYEHSQQMFHLGTYGFSMLPPFNKMLVLYLQTSIIFMCGGRDFDNYNVKNQTFFYSVEDGKMVNQMNSGNELASAETKPKYSRSRFKKMLSMSKKRHSHMGIYSNKLKSVLVFGGINQKNETLVSCETYSIFQNVWKDLPSMKIPRADGNCFQYRNKIYLFGGRSNQLKLSKKIELFSIQQSTWTVLKFKIHRGIENALVFSQAPNQLLILGGATHFYNCKTVIKIDLNQQTYIWDSELNKEYNHTKGIKVGQELMIFGGQRDTCEIFTKNKWKAGLFSHRKIIQIDELQDFSFIRQSLFVKSYQNNSSIYNKFSQQEQVFFGTDQYPCLLLYNKQTAKIRKKAVPMNLRLKKNMQIVQLPKKLYMLLGGCDKQQKKVSRSCFFYDAYQNKANQSLKMNEKKINFAAILYQNQVYVFGGYNPVQNVGFVNCQKFNIQQQKWIQLHHLDRPKYKTFAQIIGQHKIAVFGKYQNGTPVTQIQIYYTKRDQFDTFTLQTTISNHISIVYAVQIENKIIILGQDEQSNIIQVIQINQQKLIQKEIQKSAKKMERPQKKGIQSLTDLELEFISQLRESKQRIISEYESSQLHKNNIIAMKARLVEIKPIKVDSQQDRVHGQLEDSSFQVENIVQYNKKAMIQSHQQGFNKIINQQKLMPQNFNYQDQGQFNIDIQSFEANLSTLQYKQSVTQKKESEQANSKKQLESAIKIIKKHSIRQLEGISKQKHKMIKRQNQIFFFNENEVTVFNTIKDVKITNKIQSQTQLKLFHIA